MNKDSLIGFGLIGIGFMGIGALIGGAVVNKINNKYEKGVLNTYMNLTNFYRAQLVETCAKNEFLKKELQSRKA